jgi:hypothetical protein
VSEKNGSENIVERRESEERRRQPRRADDWRDYGKKILQIAGLIAVVSQGLGWSMNQLGKRVVGTDDAIGEIAKTDSSQWHDIRRNTGVINDQARTSDALLSMVCPMYQKMFMGAPLPRECPK